MVFLHIILGMSAFIGALGLGVAFRDSFTELSTPKKAAIILSYVGAVGSTILGFMSATSNPFILAATIILVVVFSIVLFKKSDKSKTK